MKISLKAARNNCNLSQVLLAKKLGVSKSTISRWESGDIPIPEKMLRELCVICGVNEKNIKVRKEIKTNEN